MREVVGGRRGIKGYNEIRTKRDRLGLYSVGTILTREGDSITNPGLRQLSVVLGLIVSALTPKAALAILVILATVTTVAHIVDVVDVAKDKSLIYIDLHEGHFRLRV